MRLDRKAGLLGLGTPDLRTLFENVDHTLIQGRNASSTGTIYIPKSSAEDYTFDVFVSLTYGYIGIYKFDFDNFIPTDILYKSSNSYCGWYKPTTPGIYYANSVNASSSTTARGGLIMLIKFKYPTDVVYNVLSNVSATRIVGRSSTSSASISYTIADHTTKDIIILQKGNSFDIVNPSTDTLILHRPSGESETSSSNGTTRSVTGVYAGSIIGLTKNT